MRGLSGFRPAAATLGLALCAAGLVLCATVLGCDSGKTMRPLQVAVNGNARHGRQIIESYGCGACHMIPGVHNARGMVGPPLILFSERTMIAGELPNTPDNLVRWVEHPRSVEPNTAMPDLGLTDDQAYDVAAYLETLH